MAAYAAVVSLINRLNEHMCFDHIWLDRLTFYCRIILDKYKSAEDRESLESVFRAAIGEGLLSIFFSLICRLDELLNSQQIACPRKYGEFLSHYNLYFPREALRNFRPNQGLVKEHVLDCYKVILAWKHLDGYLNWPCYIQDLKAPVCLVEAFLRYHPPMNKNDQKQIQVLANEAEALVDTVNAHAYPRSKMGALGIQADALTDRLAIEAIEAEAKALVDTLANEVEALVDTINAHSKPQSKLVGCRVKDHSESHSRMCKMQKKFEWLTKRKWQYESSTTCTNDFAAVHSLCSSLSRRSHSSLQLETNLVGCDDDLIKIKEQLIGFTNSLSIVSVVGMGGIGKTALTRAVYDDSFIEHYFYIRSWTVVSQGYELRKMLLGILSSVSHSTDELYMESNEQLAEHLYRRLKGRRYLIVLDDIWDIGAWNDVRKSFPDDNNGSRIIFTSRHTNIASHANTRSLTHGMHLLNMDQSMKLLSLKVLGIESFPLELDNVGKQIAGKCQGLPLAIIVVAGIMAKINKTLESWEDVAKSLGSFQNNGSSKKCFDVLALSYKYLPQHLKPCFLYIGAFPKNEEISVTRIIKLLVAEGFLWAIEGKTMEEAAEEYLEDLICRNLLMATKRGYDGRVIKCNMHDLLRDISIRESKREKFLNIFNASPGVPYSVSRRFFCSGIDPDDEKHLPESSFYSFLAFGRVNPHIDFSSTLKVLDISFQPFSNFPREILHLKFLRYLALASFDDLPPSVSKLHQLQTLVRHCHEARLILPEEIWIMKWLRHLYFKKSCSLQFPKIFPERRGAQGSELYLPNLHTLSTLSFGTCFEEILTRLPNLKKLGLREEEGERLSDEKLLYLLNNLKVLSCLETLKCFFTKQRPLPMPDAFPPNLKHLTLKGCRRPWKEMSILSALPKLEVLKLKDCAFEGSEWELTEEEVFYQLKAMVIDIADLEQWEACSIHFPNLHSLVLKYCKHLNEIPIGIGDINTLQLIELWACSTSAYDSAERIQEEQQNSGNDGLTVRIHRVHNDEWHTYTPGSSSAANSEVEI